MAFKIEDYIDFKVLLITMGVVIAFKYVLKDDDVTIIEYETKNKI
jgi:hypothetical protein